jgi:S1-C subfamily serine protease
VVVLGLAHFDLVDLVLLVLVVASAVHGLRLGAAIQVFSFGGFWLGLLLGALVAPLAVGLVHSPAAKAVVSLVVVFGSAAVVGGAGRLVGVRLWRVLRRVRLASADAVLGAVIAIVATLLASWLVASILAGAPFPALVSEIEGSAILRGLNGVLPPAPAVFARIEAIIDTSGFPLAVTGLPPPAAGSVALPSSPLVQQAVALAGPSMVEVEGVGCGQIQEGSGFVVAPNLVVTNAHVVAGIPAPYVIGFDGGRYATEPIYFNPRFDLAVLRVPGLAEPPLALDPDPVPHGTQAAVLGYPEGGPFQAVPAAVVTEFPAEGSDIYGQGLTVRHIYELQAVVRPGNSGGPLVEPDGRVIGVVFSRSVSDPNVGYALASPGVLRRVRQAEADPAPSGTGQCISS